MQTESFKVMNVKCGGCASNIQTNLTQLPGVATVEVDIATGTVEVQGEGLNHTTLITKLAELGYPVANS
ncbi:MAG: heavy-metal-associated domain-containing protein [Gammaproteobacteria bacterium]|nr:heavy-metal-associated domain-containing protein [Gammaproteobacteria bacterium]MDH5653641.1 heavy-metal-associated domain-containing protein [Gammaproteobacteria bacterium]